MLAYLSKTISTLCRDIAAMHDHLDPVRPGTCDDDVTEVVLEQLRKMPTFLSRIILFATAVFGISRLFVEGSLFHNRPQDRRCFQVERWRRSRFTLSRDLIKFYTSLVVLALYSRREIETRENASDG